MKRKYTPRFGSRLKETDAQTLGEFLEEKFPGQCVSPDELKE